MNRTAPNVLAANLAKRGAKIKPCKMCSSCAFKLNSAANLEPDTVELAMHSVITPNAKFMCHEDISKQCGGYTMVLQLDE